MIQYDLGQDKLGYAAKINNVTNKVNQQRKSQ